MKPITVLEAASITTPLHVPLQPPSPRPVRHWCGCGRAAVDFLRFDDPRKPSIPVCGVCAAKYEKANE